MSERPPIHDHASYLLWATLLGSSQDIALSVSQSGTILDLVSSGNHPLPSEQPNLLGNQLEALFPLSIASDIQRLLVLGLATGRIQTIEYQLSGGHFTRYHEVRIVPAKNQTAIVMIRDITEHKWSDDALKISESYFRRLLEDLHVGVLIFGPDAIVRLSNNIAQSLLGMADDELLDRVPDDIELEIATEDGTWIRQGLGDLVRHVASEARELKNVLVGLKRNRLHSRVWLLLNARPAVDPDSVLQLVTLTLSDVTDLRYAEIALRESEELYQTLVEGMSDCIFQADTSGSWTFLNPAWHHITGFPVEECIDQECFSFVHPDDRPVFLDEFRSAISGGKDTFRLEIRLITQDKNTVWVEMRGRATRSSDGVGLGVSGTLVDVSDRKLNQLHEAELAAHMKMVETLRELMGAFTHDVRTPLTTIKTYLYLLRRLTENTGNLPRYLDALDLQVTNLTRAVEDMAIMSRLDDEATEFQITPVDFNNLVSAVVDQLEPQALVKNQIIQLTLADVLPVVYLDSGWAAIAVRNLIINAIQHTRDNTQIVIRIYEHPYESAMVVLEVADFGSGIDPSDLPFIFDRFYRGDKSRSSGFGRTGLGLAIAKKIVELHGGVVTVHSVVGEGTTFHLALPIEPRNAASLDTLQNNAKE